MTERKVCVVSNEGCRAPAGIQAGGLGGPVGDGDGWARAMCHTCGEDVCGSPSCSARVRRGPGPRIRLCANCVGPSALERRLWSRVNKAGPVPEHRPDLGSCWQWLGWLTRCGYARMGRGGKEVLVHRVLYERDHGQIPFGLVSDHLCRNHGCVNPRHIEVVTDQVNILRGIGPSAKNASVVSCPRGHQYTAENTAVYDGKRHCRACRKVNDAARYERRVAHDRL